MRCARRTAEQIRCEFVVVLIRRQRRKRLGLGKLWIAVVAGLGLSFRHFSDQPEKVFARHFNWLLGPREGIPLELRKKEAGFVEA
jgi:hypothetical protein